MKKTLIVLSVVLSFVLGAAGTYYGLSYIYQDFILVKKEQMIGLLLNQCLPQRPL